MYTTQTRDDIINERFADAEAHAEKINKWRESAYQVVEWIKVLFVATLSFGGAGWAMRWLQTNSGDVNGAIMASTMILIGVGPWVALVLAHYVKVGVFMSVEKKVALFVIFAIIVEEGFTMRAMRDPAFANWFMIDFAPISSVVLLACIALISYLRSDLKAKRDLVEMRVTEKDLTAKNATEARILSVKEERRTRSIRKMVGVFGHGVEAAFSAAFMVPITFWYKIGSAWRKTVHAAKIDTMPATTTKKSGAGGSKSPSKTRAARKR